MYKNARAYEISQITKGEMMFIDFAEAVQYKHLLLCDDSGQYGPQLSSAELRRLETEPPNLSMNIRGATLLATEKRVWATVEIALQLTALILPAFTTYYWSSSKDSRPIPGYGYPTFLVGTLAVCLGARLCSHVVGSKTTDGSFWREASDVGLVLRLQRSCTVNDQHFRPYALFNSYKSRNIIRTSRLNDETNR